MDDDIEEPESTVLDILGGIDHTIIVDGHIAADIFRAKVDEAKAEEKARLEKLKNTIVDIDNIALIIGDIVISSTNRGVVKYKIVGETPLKWKVIYLSGNKKKDSMKVRMIDKDIDLYKI